MSPASRCLSGASRAFNPAPALRVPVQAAARRTLTSVHSSRCSASSQPATATKKQRGFKTSSSLWERSRREHGGPATFRTFSSSAPRHKLTTIEQIRTRNKGGPFNLTAAILFVGAAGGMYVYFTTEKARMQRQRIANETKGIGKPKVGGPFDLVDHNGKTFTHENLLGKYSLIYFGFSHCPDICPDELDKMALMYEKVRASCGDVIIPIMVTCDPARDSPAVLKEYLGEFHPAILGLTGLYDNIKQTCKEYRVYFSTPEKVKPGQDYLVDHSIYFYLMDPEGDFVEAIGRNFTADQAAKVISDHIQDWGKPLKKDRWA